MTPSNINEFPGVGALFLLGVSLILLHVFARLGVFRSKINKSDNGAESETNLTSGGAGKNVV